MNSPQTAIRTAADATPPRPGWAKALGIGHIVVATLMSLVMVGMLFWTLAAAAASRTPGEDAAAMSELNVTRVVWFTVVDAITGLIGNGFTFASGVALFNLKPWGARVWRWLAPAKVGRLVVVWSAFVIGVAPVIARNLAQLVIKLQEQELRTAAKRFPTVGELTIGYSWMFLAMGIGMVVLGSIYPAATWWLVGRPGLRGALVNEGPGQGPVGAEPVAEAGLS